MRGRKKKIVYISGPMRGILERDSRDAFNRAYTLLEAEGYEPVDPWDLHDAIPFFDDKAMLQIDLEIVQHCDAIYMLRGWSSSEGAMEEHSRAVMSDLGILYETDPEA